VSNPIVVTAPATTTTTAPPPVTKPATIAFTGADIAGMVAAGLALLGLGGFLVLLTRRRRQAGGNA
jgi:LPXTG-motif cell wall-anchored protein